MPIYPPYVIERTNRGERSYDIFSRLLMDRIIFLGTPIDDNVANIIVAQLLFLDAEDPEREIYLYVNSPGGGIYAGLAIYDTIQHMRAPVSTFAVGQPIERIEDDVDRDRFMSPEEAVEYGLIDRILEGPITNTNKSHPKDSHTKVDDTDKTDED